MAPPGEGARARRPCGGGQLEGGQAQVTQGGWHDRNGGKALMTSAPLVSLARRNPQGFGLAVTVLGVAFFFPDALVIRLIGADTMTVAVWRGLAAGVATLAALALFAPARMRDGAVLFSLPGLAMVVLQGVGSVFFLGSLGHTTAANTLLILATAPFLAALFAALLLGERVDRPTLWAILAAFAGVVIIAWGSVERGGWLGDLLSLCNAVTVALYYVVLRAVPGKSLILPITVGYFVTALIAWPLAPMSPLDLRQAALVVVSGAVILAGGAALLMLGPRYLPAAEVALITMLEIVAGPALVWWVLDEAPAGQTLVGGGVILTAVLMHAIVRLRQGGPLREEPA